MNGTPDDSNDWKEWRQHVLQTGKDTKSAVGDLRGEVQKLSTQITTVQAREGSCKTVTKLGKEVASLKVKASAWGGAAALLVVIGTMLAGKL